MDDDKPSIIRWDERVASARDRVTKKPAFLFVDGEATTINFELGKQRLSERAANILDTLGINDTPRGASVDDLLKDLEHHYPKTTPEERVEMLHFIAGHLAEKGEINDRMPPVILYQHLKESTNRVAFLTQDAEGHKR